ncbi:FadR/GntR family transcriptional regulator [Candidatus Protofrankia californiensis]|uniref:FadR/GntR family transcriptional regulator n=1 Tax=Candidatus Protofrankia californiensis TaxID=1839754 RepID=UPI0013ED4A7D|nr:FadR/GntR family transcriptional regulator [Candidatus Protofrankia californiensis]
MNSATALALGKSGARLHQHLVHRFLEEIAAGTYPEGGRLPSEIVLAGQLGVSRGVIRELLRSLESKHVVHIQAGRGAWVHPISEWNVLDIDVLVALMATPASVTVLAHYLECRRILETESAALAAQHATGDDLRRMADTLAQMDAIAASAQIDPDDALFHQADIAFHSTIFQASGNQVLPRVVEPIQHVMAALRPKLALHPEHRRRRTVPEHKAILDAIADRDSDRARKAMAAHLGTVEAYLQEYRLRLLQGTSPSESTNGRATRRSPPPRAS